MLVVHLTSSRFFGGPERQMLELAEALGPGMRSAFISFAEGGACGAFLDRVRDGGAEAIALKHDTPRLVAAMRELTATLRDWRADVLCCHGYKADMLGMLAGRRLGIPVIAVSRGWTGETLRVRLYDAMDRRVLPAMDRVVCVSEAQAEKVRCRGVAPGKVVVIRNAIRSERFQRPSPDHRARLQQVFRKPPRWIVGAAGRLSPEKGFGFLIDAAATVLGEMPTAGFVVFGDGALRPSLQQQIDERGLQGRFVLAGFRSDLDDYLPHIDLLVLPSLTEGLPNIALESLAAGVPVVATDVGGTREVVRDEVDGYLVPSANPPAIAARVSELLADDWLRQRMGADGRRWVRAQFSFAAQAAQYRRLFAELGIGESPGEAQPAECESPPQLACETSND
ncbi:MAG: glycosyltransferase family 4 protein [Planctomycetaceae bacterium]|nr:glycosyltransferase family 4 protein [Planctomycetaceae bacterium]